MKLLHQCGHNSSWNIKALENEKVGDGLILSPVHERFEKIHKMSHSILRNSFFDPQYYLPNSQKVKLSTYKFFPETITKGFSTLDFSLVSLESAKQCIEFQLRQDFERIIIPARFFKQMVTDYASKQEAYCVIPFLKEITRQKVKKPIYLTVPLTSHMVEDSDYRTAILNWITSFPELTGIYLIVDHERSTKQVISEGFLFQMMVLITELKAAGLEIVIGYTNTESLLYTVAGDIDVTMGAYENTRIFSLDKFIESDDERRGPKARIYLSGLLNWVQFGQAKELSSEDATLWSRVYNPTSHSEAALRQAAEPTFNQSPLYMHYFISFRKQFNELAAVSRIERYKKLSNWLKQGIENDLAIENIPISLERHGKGEHLQHWLNALNKYYRKYLKA